MLTKEVVFYKSYVGVYDSCLLASNFPAQRKQFYNLQPVDFFDRRYIKI